MIQQPQDKSNVYVLLVVNGNADQILNALEENKLLISGFLISFSSVLFTSYATQDQILATLEEININNANNYIMIDISDNLTNNSFKYLFQEMQNKTIQQLFKFMESITNKNGNSLPNDKALNFVKDHTLNVLLEKINSVGMDSLTEDELEKLHSISH